MMVPAPMVELYKAYPALHQTPRQQAVIPERGLAWLRAVELVRRLRLFRDVHQFRDARLHPVGQFVGRDPGGDLRVADFREMILIQIAQGIERLSSDLRVHSVRVRDEQHRVAFRTKLHALVSRGQKAASPARFAAIRVAVSGEQDDEAGQVLILAAEPVGKPGAHARATDQLMAAVHKYLRRGVVELVGMHRADDADIVHDLRQIRQLTGDLGSRLPVALESVRGAQQFGRAFDKREPLSLNELLGDLLAVVLVQFRLVVQQIELRRRARHEEEDDVFGFRAEMRLLRRHWVHNDGYGGMGRSREQPFVQQGGERHRAYPVGALPEEVAAGNRLQHRFLFRLGILHGVTPSSTLRPDSRVRSTRWSSQRSRQVEAGSPRPPRSPAPLSYPSDSGLFLAYTAPPDDRSRPISADAPHSSGSRRSASCAGPNRLPATSVGPGPAPPRRRPDR